MHSTQADAASSDGLVTSVMPRLPQPHLLHKPTETWVMMSTVKLQQRWISVLLLPHATAAA
jgi:hypothetical protein